MTDHDNHLDCELVRDRGSDYLDGQLSAASSEAIDAHLGRCPGCRRFIAELRLTIQALAELRLDAPVRESEDHALRLFHHYFPEPAEDEIDWTRVKTLWGELAENERGALEGSRLALPDTRLCQFLLRKAEERVSSHPGESDKLASLCLRIAEKSRVEQRDNILADCWAVIALVKVTLSNINEARRALRKAEGHAKRGSRPALTLARLCMARGWIESVTGYAEEATEAFTEAHSFLRQAGLRHRAVCMQLNLGASWLQRGRVRTARAVLQEAVEELSELEAPARVKLAGFSNLAIAYCESGQPELASSLLPSLRELTKQVGGESVIRLQWVLGTIARTSGDSKRAVRYFREVQRHYRRRGEYVHFVESSLDIARVFLASGDWPSLVTIVTETATECREVGADDDVVRALMLLREGAVQRTLDEARLRACLLVLRGWPRGIRFTP